MKIKILTIAMLLAFCFPLISQAKADSIVYDTDYSLDAGYYGYYPLSVTSTPTYGHIEMTCDDDINLYIFIEAEYNKWKIGETASGVSYENVDGLNVYHSFRETGTWYVVLDNSDSIVTGKSGHIKITDVDEVKPSDLTVTINPLSYQAWPIETTKANVKVSVNILCDGSDINFFIADDANFKAWKGGSTAATGILRPDIITLEEEFTLSDADIWWFVLDNTDSILTSKTVTISITIVTSTPGFDFLLVPLIAFIAVVYRKKRH
ncbi:MAG: hypothetical protein ACFFD4_35370 [Candidatus Odinarchaeota archaeon]